MIIEPIINATIINGTTRSAKEAMRLRPPRIMSEARIIMITPSRTG